MFSSFIHYGVGPTTVLYRLLTATCTSDFPSCVFLLYIPLEFGGPQTASQVNSAWPGQLSLAIPPWVGAMSTGQRAVMPCDWGVKADMVLFAGNTV